MAYNMEYFVENYQAYKNEYFIDNWHHQNSINKAAKVIVNRQKQVFCGPTKTSVALNPKSNVFAKEITKESIWQKLFRWDLLSSSTEWVQAKVNVSSFLTLNFEKFSWKQPFHEIFGKTSWE